MVVWIHGIILALQCGLTMPERYRILPGGIYVFPDRGVPPPVPPGYRARPGNPYVLEPDFKQQCPFRVKRSGRLPCGSMGINDHCNHLGGIVTPSLCNDCCPVDKATKRQEIVRLELLQVEREKDEKENCSSS